MILNVSHTTRYAYASQATHLVQKLRLTPRDSRSQTILDWSIRCPGIDRAAVHTDGLGNIVHLVAQSEPTNELAITATGRVETRDTGGVSGPDEAQVNPRMFLRATDVTRSSPGIDELAGRARQMSGGNDVTAHLHALMALISEAVVYETDTTDAGTSAAEAFEAGHGVCQDHAHILIAAARLHDIPARYVTGYLHIDGGVEAAAHHAWAEAYVPDLGWVGFDPANGICPTENYLRLAVGFDANGAAPVIGVRKGDGGEILTVDVTVKQQQQ